MTSPVCHLSHWVGSVRRLCHLAGGTTLWNQNRLITGIITRPWILKSATRYRDSRLAKSRETSCNPYILVLLMPLFLTAGVCLSWSLPSITEQLIWPHRLPWWWMYAVLAEESLTSHLFKNQVHNGWQSLSLFPCTLTIILCLIQWP